MNTVLNNLPAILCELVPSAREILARVAVDAYRSAPWGFDMTKADAAGQQRLGYSAADARVGSHIIGEFLPYSLIYGELNRLLRRVASDPEGSLALLQNCGNLMSAIMADDLGVKEALSIYIAEDIDLDVAGRLARFTPLGRCTQFLEESGVGEVRAAPGCTDNAGELTNSRRFIRYLDSWDAPAFFLEEVPQAAEGFSAVFAEAVRRGAEGGGTEGNFDQMDAVIGRPVRDMGRPERLVRDVVGEIVNEMFRGDNVSDDIVNRCCKFISAAIEADRIAGGHLFRVLNDKISYDFARVGVEVYREEDEFMSILRRIVRHH